MTPKTSAPPRDPAPASWRGSETFAHLLGLARAFLLDEVDTFPGWGGASLDEESDRLLPTLLAANRAGVLTIASQPGRPFAPGHDGRAWAGRAFLGGFAAAEVAADLSRRAREHGLWIPSETEGAAVPPSFEIPAGLRDGLPYLVLGAGARELELEIFAAAIGISAYAELRSRTLLWIIDPVWGRRSRLESLFPAEGGV